MYFGGTMALMYCKKCGRLVLGHYESRKNDPFYCDCCNSLTYFVPEDFLFSETVPLIKKDLEQQFIDEYIKSSPEFDQYLFDHRDEILSKQSAELDAKLAIGRAILEEQNRTVKCSYCGSSNIRKIGLFSRAVSTELWGLASKKIGKQFHCNNCGADF